MKQLLNTLYVMTQGAYLTLDHETVKVEVSGKTQLQAPLHHLGALFTFGNVMMSPFLMHHCTENGKAIVFLDANGRFLARVVGKTTGNVLLRQAQFEAVRGYAEVRVHRQKHCSRKTAKLAANPLTRRKGGKRRRDRDRIEAGGYHPFRRDPQPEE